jgi:hypothetical protein
MSQQKKIDEAIEELFREYKANGRAAIERLRERNPVLYLELVKSLFPDEFEINVEEYLADLPDDEIKRLQAIAARLQAH